MNAQFAELLELPITEKLQLVEDLWDNIAATPATCSCNGLAKRRVS